ncbi:unnamed protein product [Protopolystoma xenopodis]|uniref:Uncharacterized protein n=1 Tax=Protopolystoma xenopodis TaxID=117903 RepID=A0A3S5CQK2_9PLAT|nr:unnamed protein product [Protopolystoma xenopodis]
MEGQRTQVELRNGHKARARESESTVPVAGSVKAAPELANAMAPRNVPLTLAAVPALLAMWDPIYAFDTADDDNTGTD